MFRTSWVTHRLGLAVAATAVLVGGSSTTLAQSATVPTKELSETKPTSLSLSDSKLKIGIKSGSVPEEWLAGFEMKCVGCGLSEARGAESTNRNAPWVLQGSWRRETAFGVISAGFVGVRNYALPLYTAMPIGDEFAPVALGSAGLSAFAASSQWSMTAALEKTMATLENGATVGVTTDLLVPMATGSVAVGDSRFSALTSPTVRLGIVFRW